jgi:hypothetical protein
MAGGSSTRHTAGLGSRGHDWAPSWVASREADGACAWAPLPLGAVFDIHEGLLFGGVVAGVNVDFGLGAEAFVAIDVEHFWEHDYRAYVYDHDRLRGFYDRSYIHNEFRMENAHLAMRGFPTGIKCPFNDRQILFKKIRHRNGRG